MERPLEGIRALDCGIYHAGPGGLAILGDLGAEVIKIEQPGIGDPIRRVKHIGNIPMISWIFIMLMPYSSSAGVKVRYFPSLSSVAFIFWFIPSICYVINECPPLLLLF